MPRQRQIRWLLLALLAASCAAPGPPRRTPEPQPDRPDRPPAPAPVAKVRIGAILPQTGGATLRQYGDLVRQGLDLAFADADSTVELIVVDDGGSAERAAALVRELEGQGVVAILGPLLGEAVDIAAAARTDAELALLSPTSSQRPRGANSYTLNAGDTEGAAALARYALTRGLPQVALLYPAGAEFRAYVSTFRTTLEQGGGRIVADIAWTPGLTTFAEPLERLRASGARAVLVAATERDIRQLAPQFPYYGLGGIQILGSEAWAEDEVLTRVPVQQLEGVVAAVPFLSSSGAVAWDQFVGRYEAAQRRTLDNPYPALGYDAGRLVLEAVRGAQRASRGDVARNLAATRAFRGATGVLSLTDGAVTRRPFLVRIRAGRPEPIPDIER